MKTLIERLRKNLEDPEEVEKMKKYFKDIQDKKQRDNDRVNLFFYDDNSFEKFLLRLIDKHDKRWEDVCYEQGCEPYSWNLLNAVFELAQHNGDEVMPIDGLTREFSSLLMKYRDFTFAWTFGQGTCVSIFNKDNELIYRT